MVLIEEVDSPRASDEKDSGNQFFSRGDTNRAIQAYSNGIRKLSDESLKDPSILYSNRAQAYIKLKKWEDALTDCRQAIAYNSQNGKAYYRQGLCLVALGRLVDGQKALQESLRVCNDSAPTLLPAIQDALDDCEKKIEETISMEKTNKTQTSIASSRSTSADSTEENLDSNNKKSGTSNANESENILPSDYAHPSLDIQYVEKKGRGLVVTESIQRGTLLFSIKPILNTTVDGSKKELSDLLSDRISSFSDSLTEDEGQILLDLHAEKFNDTIRTQVLKRGTKQLPDPPKVSKIIRAKEGENAKFKTPKKKSISAETAGKLSSAQIDAIVQGNAYSISSDRISGKTSSSNYRTGLWLLPSFINHSCISNVTSSFREIEIPILQKNQKESKSKSTVLFELRAASDLSPGDEIVFSYLHLSAIDTEEASKMIFVPIWERELLLKKSPSTPLRGVVSLVPDLRAKLERILLLPFKDESEEWLSSCAELKAQKSSSDTKSVEKTLKAVKKIKTKVEKKLKKVIDNAMTSGTLDEILESDNSKLSKSTIYNILCASYETIFEIEASCTSTSSDEKAYLYRRLAVIRSSVQPYSDVHIESLVNAGSSSWNEAFHVYKIWKGGSNHEFSIQSSDDIESLLKLHRAHSKVDKVWNRFKQEYPKVTTKSRLPNLTSTSGSLEFVYENLAKTTTVITKSNSSNSESVVYKDMYVLEIPNIVIPKSDDKKDLLNCDSPPVSLEANDREIRITYMIKESDNADSSAKTIVQNVVLPIDTDTSIEPIAEVDQDKKIIKISVGVKGSLNGVK